MHAHKTRVDVGMRLVCDVDDFETVGKLMDEVASIVETALDRAHLSADFDYTHFRTRKASRMEDHAHNGHEPAAPPLTVRG